MMKMRIVHRIERVARTKFVLVSLSFTLFWFPVVTGAGLISHDGGKVLCGTAVRLPAGHS
jgi:hypothetical protein